MVDPGLAVKSGLFMLGLFAAGQGRVFLESRFKVGLTPYVFHVGGAASGWVVSTPREGPFSLKARNRGHDDDLTVMPDKFSIQL